MLTLTNNIKTVVLYSDFKLVALLNSVLAILWGVWLILPIGVFSTGPAFGALAKLAPEYVYGIVLTFIGLVSLLNFRHRFASDYHARPSFYLFVFWLFVATLLAISNWKTTGTIVYSLIAISNGLVYLKIRLERNEV